MSRNSLTNGQLGSALYIAFDTETTGLWAPTNRLLEIGALKFSLSGQILGTFQALINPQCRIPADVIPIHGITDDMVAHAKSAPYVLSDFFDFCGTGSIFIAHNAPFDMSFISYELGRAGLPLPSNPILDTVTLFQRYFPGLQSYSLISLARQFLQISTQEHRSLADADLVRQLFCAVAPKIPPVSSDAGSESSLPVLYFRPGQIEPVSLPDHYSDVAIAIANRTHLEIEYHATGKAPQTRIVRPLRIFSQSGTLYLSAHCELAGETRTFRLDRIKSFRMLNARSRVD